MDELLHDDARSTVTRLLQEVGGGNAAAVDALVAIVYDELRAIARRQRSRWHGDYTLNTTALVHEAYLKLAGSGEPPSNRAHFMAVASRAMRQLLVDQARRRNAQKRGGEIDRVSLDHPMADAAAEVDIPEDKLLELLVLDDALERLAKTDEAQARVVECRFFGGLTIEETAEALNVSPATVKVRWSLARSWLFNEIGR